MENNPVLFTNIGNIRSVYIIKIVFSFLEENKELMILSRNKTIQKELEIDINNFKKASRIKRIISENGKGQEFLRNTKYLIFEGEYKNGMKHGKGIEYFFNFNLGEDSGYFNWERKEEDKEDYYLRLTKFQGEYFEGKKISGSGYDKEGNLILKIEKGKGEEYYDNKNLQFKGEYKNGKRWNGKGYNYKGEEIFEIKNGGGKGKIFDYKGNLIFEGEFLNGVRNGKGKEYYTDGKILFEGEYYNDIKINGNKYNIKGDIILTLENSKGKRFYHSYEEKKTILLLEGEYLGEVPWGYCKNYNFEGI